MPSTNPAARDQTQADVAALRDAAEVAALRLSGDDVDASLEDMAEMLARLEQSCDELAAATRGAWKSRLTAARKHFHEARDLLDDGEPSDAVALEVMAGREGLRN